MSQQVKVTRELDVTGATLLGFHFPEKGRGKTFYVGTSSMTGAASGNEGTNPNYPLTTLAEGIAACTDDQGDYVIVLDCYDDDTFPISIDKSTCHVIGLSNPTTWAWAALNGGGEDVFRFADNYIELAGFSIISAAADGIHFYANNGYHWLHNLDFGVAAASVVNAIEFDSTYGTNSLIENCAFGSLTTSITGYGIYGGAHQSTIRNNVFQACATAAIYITSSPTTGYIYGNLIAVTDDVNGEAITLDTGVTGFMVVNNIAVNGMLSAGWTYNPYRDLAANTANHWGMNYRSNAVVEPVGV